MLALLALSDILPTLTLRVQRGTYVLALLEESSTCKVCCPNCEQLLVNPSDGCGIRGWIPSFQKVLEENKPHSLENDLSVRVVI